jgi:hypothetical protein
LATPAPPIPEAFDPIKSWAEATEVSKPANNNQMHAFFIFFPPVEVF